MSTATGHPDDVRFVTARDGRRLFVREYGAPDAGRTLVLVHGYGEHGGRYEHRLGPFIEAGFRIVVPDVRGHGRSDGRRGHVLRFEQYLDDLERVFEVVKTPAARTVLFGHSHGGLIAARYTLSHPGAVAALGLSSPFFGLAVKAPAWKIGAGRLLSRVLPTVSLPTEIESKWVSHDPGVVAAYDADPLNHHVVNTRWFTEAMKSIEVVHRLAPSMTTSTLVVQAGDDKLVEVAASRSWAAAVPGAIYEEVPEAFHELWFEPDGARHAARFCEFFDARTR
jgi:alpha-beta hydrolase superfamily lysophospholipase